MTDDCNVADRNPSHDGCGRGGTGGLAVSGVPGRQAPVLRAVLPAVSADAPARPGPGPAAGPHSSIAFTSPALAPGPLGARAQSEVSRKIDVLARGEILGGEPSGRAGRGGSGVETWQFLTRNVNGLVR